jgi:hypothetical protein
MKQKFTIPTELNHIKLDALIELSKYKDKGERVIALKTLELMCEIPKELAMTMSMEDVDYILSEVDKVLTGSNEDIRTFEMDGKRYGRIPNILKASFGEYVSMDAFITPAFEGEIKHDDAFQFLSTIYRPIVDEVKGLYRIEPYTEEYIDREMWKTFKEHCPSDVYVSSVAFFLKLRLESLITTRQYLREQEATPTVPALDLDKIGVGMDQLITSQRETYLNMTQSPRCLFKLPSLNSDTKLTAEQ